MKIKLTLLVFFLLVISVNAQIYTPNGAIQGTSTNNNIGIGTTSPTANLEINSSSIVGSETLLKLRVSDAPQDYFRIANATNGNGQFIPTLNGYRLSDSRASLYITATTEISNDINSDPLMVFDSRTTAAPIDNRPLFAWDSYGNRKMILTSNGYLGIGTSAPEVSLDVNGTARVTSVFYVNDIMGANGGDIKIGPNTANNSSTIFTIGGATKTEIMRVNYNGNIGIGTSNPTSKLTVAGNINSREVKVTVNAGADFVFENDYNLPSLDVVDKYIKENKHLPEIASADEMKKEGINLSEMNIKLLQKIEEMTLYMIEQNKSMEDLKKEIKNIKSKIK